MGQLEGFYTKPVKQMSNAFDSMNKLQLYSHKLIG